MATLKDTISQIQKELQTALDAAKTENSLEKIRVEFLGRNGKLATLMAELKNLPVEEKRVYGPALNELKQTAETIFAKRKQELLMQASHTASEEKKHFDVTAYKHSPLKGALHVYTKITQELEDIFISMGYEVVDGPEIETDYYNFEALNIPKDHPARDMHDTFWLNLPGMLMRTHTSNVQIRIAENQKPPLAIFSSGRVYRNEAIDASHNFMFSQTEGLLIDKNISMGNLLATAKTFLSAVLDKKDIDIRVRPGYFPFVEPGVEIDAACPFCTDGCSICKKTGWIELLGAGLVHPNVLKYCNIDPEQYSGFAFGMGLERLAMIKYGIDDIRLFHSSKPHFLDQF